MDPPGDSTASAVLGSGRSRVHSAFIRWIFPIFGKATLLVDSATVFGRDESCTVVLPGQNVSRRHAEIVKSGPVHLLRDCQSKNGVFVDGRRIAESPLSPGNLIRLGDWLGVVGVSELPQVPRASLENYGDSLYAGPMLAALLAPVRAAAASEISIILEGKTGTGKERVARAIHAWSGRPGPFVAINCAAVPESLAEAEFFGHRKGAFTGADSSSIGHIRAASNGTLLLDEVTDLPLSVQAKLLRALQEREVTPLGETKPSKVDVRVIAASQVPIGGVVERGAFRGDLWARLSGLTVRLPTLAERKEEIPALFLRMLADSGMPDVTATVECIERLCLHAWPLNLRELGSLTRRLAVIHGDVRQLTHHHLVDFEPQAPAGSAAQTQGPLSARYLRAFTVEQISALQAALAEHGNNLTKAAAVLNISRTKAYRLLIAARQPRARHSPGAPSA